MSPRTTLLVAALWLCASGAAAQNSIHDTGYVRLQVFNDGSVGAQVGFGAGFTLLGQPGLFDGRLFVGTGADRLSGEAYSVSDWTPGASVSSQTPTSVFNQIRRASFSDSGAPAPLGVTVTQTSMSSTSPQYDQFVILQYQVQNTSAAPLDGVFVGLFADFDVGDFEDQGAFDASRNLVYVSRSTQTGAHFGTTLLGDAPLAGWSVSLADGGFITDDRVFRGMTTPGSVPATPGDRVTVLGAGPYSIAAGGSVTVRYALVAGVSLADIRTSASAARLFFPTGTSEGPSAAGVELLASVPNPASAAATLGFTLDAAQDVRLAVYDVLGREIAVVVDGARSAGTHTPTLDTAGLPSGVYVVRLTAGATTVTRRFTVAR